MRQLRRWILIFGEDWTCHTFIINGLIDWEGLGEFLWSCGLTEHYWNLLVWIAEWFLSSHTEETAWSSLFINIVVVIVVVVHLGIIDFFIVEAFLSPHSHEAHRCSLVVDTATQIVVAKLLTSHSEETLRWRTLGEEGSVAVTVNRFNESRSIASAVLFAKKQLS